MMYRLTRSPITGLVEDSPILRIADNAFIPRDPGNTDFQAFLKWQAEGNVPESAPPLPDPGAQPKTVEQRLAELEARVLALET
jgi:hypothetical protein